MNKRSFLVSVLVNVCVSNWFSVLQVIPSLQRMGIGQMIVKKIVRYAVVDET